MPPHNLDYLLGRVRNLAAEYRAGTADSFDAFRELVDLLLRLTVARPATVLRLLRNPDQPGNRVLQGYPHGLVPLLDSRFLRLAISLALVPHDGGGRLKVLHSSYQYQHDEAGDQWVFRYDYLREPLGEHPGAHIQIRADLRDARILQGRQTLERIHFPTGRVSLEAVIRLLVSEFGVPCARPDVWLAVLAASEREFYQIAHRPVS